MSMGKRGPTSVVTIPVITNPQWRTMNAAEETDSAPGRVGFDLMVQGDDEPLRKFGRSAMPTSVLDRIPHAGQDTSHIGETADNARHRIVGMDFILQIHKALILYRGEGFKHPSHWHDAIAHCDLASLAFEVRKIFHVQVKQPRTCCVDRLNYICACANRMPNIDAAPHARIHVFHRLQYIERGVPQLVLRPMIVDRDTDVVLFCELLNSRQGFRSRVAGDYNGNATSLAVFEFRPDVRVFIFRKIDGSGRVKVDSARGIVSERGSLFV